MNLGQLRAQARIKLDDTVADYLWSDAELDMYINEAETEACIRALLIDDSDNADFNIDITTTLKRYQLNQKIIRIDSIILESRPQYSFDDWYTTQTSLMLKELPVNADTLILSFYRTPLEIMVDNDDAPEIAEHHHYRLIDWVCFRAFSKPDSDGNDMQRAAFHEAEFIKSFGQRPDNNVLRKQKRNTNHTVRYQDF